jgi:hypothetical protein
MPTVHVFVSTGRFRSSDELRAYIDPDYDEEGEDGDHIPSPFMSEVGLTRYEPTCIETIHSESGHPVPLAALLAGASYSDQWLPRLGVGRLRSVNRVRSAAMMTPAAPPQFAVIVSTALRYFSSNLPVPMTPPPRPPPRRVAQPGHSPCRRADDPADPLGGFRQRPDGSTARRQNLGTGQT